MNKGKYFRFGKYDAWIGYEGGNRGVIRLEWLASGLRSYEILLDLKALSQENSMSSVGFKFKCRNGSLCIKLKSKSDREIVLRITRSWCIFPMFLAEGTMEIHQADIFIKTISSLYRV